MKSTKYTIDYEAIAAKLSKYIANYKENIAKGESVGDGEIVCIPTNMDGYYRITEADMNWFDEFITHKGAGVEYDAQENEWDNAKFVKALVNATCPTIECYIDCSANPLNEGINYIINFNF